MARLFFSYAHEDINKVKKVRKALEQKGHEIWLDSSDIQVGISIPQAIQSGINNCDFFVIFLTRAISSIGSHQLNCEYQGTPLTYQLRRSTSYLFSSMIWAPVAPVAGRGYKPRPARVCVIFGYLFSTALGKLLHKCL